MPRPQFTLRALLVSAAVAIVGRALLGAAGIPFVFVLIVSGCIVLLNLLWPKSPA
jgi:hypothetical protein